MSEFEEIKTKPYLPPDRKVEGKCPSCGGNLFYEMIPCPDNIGGCAVAHFGYVCSKCFKQFSKKNP